MLNFGQNLDDYIILMKGNKYRIKKRFLWWYRWLTERHDYFAGSSEPSYHDIPIEFDSLEEAQAKLDTIGARHWADATEQWAVVGRYNLKDGVPSNKSPN